MAPACRYTVTLDGSGAAGLLVHAVCLPDVEPADQFPNRKLTPAPNELAFTVASTPSTS